MQSGSLSNGRTGKLRFSAFVPAQSVSTYFSEASGRSEALEIFQATNIHQFYSDGLRGGHFRGEDVR